jgi:hypothetical protein
LTIEGKTQAYFRRGPSRVDVVRLLIKKHIGEKPHFLWSGICNESLKAALQFVPAIGFVSDPAAVSAPGDMGDSSNEKFVEAVVSCSCSQHLSHGIGYGSSVCGT